MPRKNPDRARPQRFHQGNAGHRRIEQFDFGGRERLVDRLAAFVHRGEQREIEHRGHQRDARKNCAEIVHQNEEKRCREKMNETAHTFAWVTDKEATATEPGSRHEECTVYGYAKAAEEIPCSRAAGNAGGSAKAQKSL